MKALPSNPSAPGARQWSFLSSAASAANSVARKAIVALSGAALLAWSFLHLLGSLGAFAGPAVMDGYAAWLRRGASVPLGVLRALLLGAFGVHLVLVIGLWRRAKRARPVAYAAPEAAALERGARWLRWGSVILLVLIVGHVLHLSFGVGHPGLVAGHAYDNLVRGLDSWPIALGYVAFAVVFALHVGHGLRSAPISLGSSRREPRRSLPARGVALVLGLGFAAIPIAVGLGVLR